MSDFKMNTAEVLMAKLNINQFSFESLNGNAKKINQEIFEQAALYMPVAELEQKLYYRARIINDADGEKAGIIRENGIIRTSCIYMKMEQLMETFIKKHINMFRMIFLMRSS